MRPRKRARHRSNSQVVIPRQVNTRSNAQRNDLPSAEPGSSTQHSLMTPADPIHNNEDLFALVGEALSPIPSRTSGSVTESQSASTVRESTAPAITARSTTLANRIAPVNLIASANPITPVNANGQPIALGVHEADIEPYDFDPNTRIWTQFEMGLFRDMVFSNAFPSFEAANEASAELLRNILGTAYEENRPVSATMVLNYLQYLGHWRTQLHNSVRYWLDSYDFQNSNVPSEFATRRVGLLNYLLTNLRFARGGYTDTGRFMHSQAISDCIRVVLLNNRRAGRLTPLPDIVPRQCITLMTLMIYYRLQVHIERHAHELTTEDIQLRDERQLDELQGLGANNTRMEEQFGFDSVWQESYFDFLDPNGLVGSRVQWEDIETLVTGRVGTARERATQAGVRRLFNGLFN